MERKCTNQQQTKYRYLFTATVIACLKIDFHENTPILGAAYKKDDFFDAGHLSFSYTQK